MGGFPCSGCGLCCKSAGRMVVIAKKLIQEGNQDKYVQEVADFPYSFDTGGACEKLVNGQCSVYENRPDICNVEVTWQKHHSHGISKQNYFLSAAMVCNQMMADAQFPDNFFIQIPE
jgi:Fe-S-cluster containining protein